LVCNPEPYVNDIVAELEQAINKRVTPNEVYIDTYVPSKRLRSVKDAEDKRVRKCILLKKKSNFI
jgi:hypothetical protein